jgi:nucleosome binding factor SPN SPT16 subunit
MVDKACDEVNQYVNVRALFVSKRCDGVNLRDMELDFEIPFRELGFMGVPHRQTAFVMPTVNCLVELVEMPFTVVTMGEVNIVNLERVGFNLRNFDMTLVFKVWLSCCIGPAARAVACSTHQSFSEGL